MTKARDLGDNAQNTKPKVVNAKADLIVGTGSDAADRLAVGSNGDTLVADSSTTTGLRWSATPSASNPFLNSAMQVWQRGTSLTTNIGYTADRWYTYKLAGSHTISRQVTGDTTNLPNIQYCARVQRNSGQTNTDRSQFYQPFETTDTIPFAGKTVTVSFYARRGANYSPTGNNLEIMFASGTGTDQNPINGYTGSTSIVSQNVALTTTWQRFSVTGNIASTATQMYFGFLVNWTGTAGAADFAEITGLQMDVGSVALPFRTYSATLAGELAACQRYFQSLNGSWSTYGATGDLLANYYRHQVQMRTAPTVTITTNPTYTNASALTNDENTVTGSRFYATVTTTGRAFATNFIYSASSEL